MKKEKEKNKEKEVDVNREEFADKPEGGGYGGLIIACIIAILLIVYILLSEYAPELLLTILTPIYMIFG